MNMKKCNDSRHRAKLRLPAVALALTITSAPRADPVVVGWVEAATIGVPPHAMDAKLDTGAQTSALSAAGITPFMREGVPWVRFTIQGAKDIPAEISLALEAPLVRWVRIQRAGTKPDRRPVVTLPLCIAGLSFPTTFTLTDRTGQEYPLLIGRTALAGRLAIDSSQTHTAATTCPR
jgi:hypothetical protein